MKNTILTIVCLLILIIFIDTAFAQQDSPISMTGSGITLKEPKTNVSVTKIIEGKDGYPRLVYNLKTPRVDDFEFVLALDSSGSMGFGGEEMAVVRAVPEFIEKIPENNPGKNFRISIVSWDDDIDLAYAYGDFSNKEPRNAELVDVNQVTQDLRNNPVFGEDVYKEYYYSCDELDKTDLSKAIDASLAVFENNNETDYHRTKRFIILVTDGDSGEFSECDERLIERAENAPYPIYVIGMNVVEGTAIFDHLARLGGYDDNRIEFIYPSPQKLEDELFEALEHALQNAIIAPVAKNVTITETFYSYFNPDENSIMVRGELYGTGGNILNYKNKTPNNDGTHTIVFQLAGGLLPESEIEISFDAELALIGMPISVTKSQQPIPTPLISENTQTSSLSYEWFNGEHFPLELQDIPINIEMSRSKSVQVSGTKNVERNSQPSNSNIPIGMNFGLITFLSFAILFIAVKRER